MIRSDLCCLIAIEWTEIELVKIVELIESVEIEWTEYLIIPAFMIIIYADYYYSSIE